MGGGRKERYKYGTKMVFPPLSLPLGYRIKKVRQERGRGKEGALKRGEREEEKEILYLFLHRQMISPLPSLLFPSPVRVARS